MIDKGATLDQVKAAQLTYDYDDRYGATTGPWTTDMFGEAVYTSLKQGRRLVRASRSALYFAEQGVGFHPEASACFLKWVLSMNGWLR